MTAKKYFKALLFISLLFSFLTVANAQNFEFDPGKYIDVSFKPDGSGEVPIYYKNKSQNEVIVSWGLVKNTFDSGWDYSLCDYGTCHITIPQYAETQPIPAGDKAFFLN